MVFRVIIAVVYSLSWKKGDTQGFLVGRGQNIFSRFFYEYINLIVSSFMLISLQHKGLNIDGTFKCDSDGADILGSIRNSICLTWFPF